MHNYSKVASASAFRAGILGYTGYSGAELASLLERHPSVCPVLLDHRLSDGTPATQPISLSSDAPPLSHLPWSATAAVEHHLDIIFTATPPEVSLEVVPQILAQGAKAVDLSGAFRLTAAQYKRWYGADHSQPDLLHEAVYGLPELHRDKIRGARLVANPGCYPTAAICALWPLMQQDWVDRSAGIICDAKSGVTGAGKSPSSKTHFVQVSENFSAYAILKHRHVPEVLNNAGIEESDFAFTAHLLPTQRGILATHYLKLKRPVPMDEILAVYRAAYASSSFIRIYPSQGQPQISVVNRTNFCDIHCTLSPDGLRLVVVSCIDNLVKGAAGQAVQNMNLLLGLDETLGLL